MFYYVNVKFLGNSVFSTLAQKLVTCTRFHSGQMMMESFSLSSLTPSKEQLKRSQFARWKFPVTDANFISHQILVYGRLILDCAVLDMTRVSSAHGTQAVVGIEMLASAGNIPQF